tara:strand:- start:10527 stop:11021 length:495 start_codon:yes stop_codon:yes gene_type:complete
MFKNFTYLAIILLLSSCYTAKQAQRDVVKADVNHPMVTSGFCAEKFPVKEKIIEKTKFIKGETIVKKDTITVDCDSVVSDTTQSNKVLIQYKTVYQTDTIVKEKIIEKENTAKIKNLALQLQAKEKIIQEKEAFIKKQKGKINVLQYFLAAVSIVLLVILFFKK